ncbi:MAG: YciI family protein [Gammaproteobacteria bacterium]|nr:YciI family protein [Gammaproteobacteria bacterium]
MKYICLGYLDPEKWAAMSEREQQTFMDDCIAYDDWLRANGHFIGGEALEGVDKAATLRVRDGNVSATDGPFAETKELLGGILLLEARDMNEAIQLMSKHPGVRGGSFEIRPSFDIQPLVEASRQRRSSTRQ